MARKRDRVNTAPLYILLLVAFVAYIMLQSVAFVAYISGAAIFLLIIGIIILEVSNSTRSGWIRRDIIELLILVAIVFGLWYGMGALLGTKYPIDVVPSCSMLPTFHRGDMIVVQGVSSPAQISAPVVNVSAGSFNSMISNMGSEFLSCVAYSQNGRSATVSQAYSAGESIGLYKYSPSGGSIVPNSSQSSNLVRYSCGIVPVKTSGGQTIEYVATTSVTIANTTISVDLGDTPVVYTTAPDDLFYQEGDRFIVHRAYAIINASGSYYVLTKGDNNPGLDMQYGNYPPMLSDINGKVVLDIPYLGYLKLILSNQLSQPAGCNTTIV